MLEKIKQIILARQTAYRLVFSPQNAYTEKVLQDLARFCRADKTTFHEDPRIHAVLEGRREVFLRICDNLNLSSEELLKKIGKGDV